MAGEQNGNVLRERIEQLRHRLKGTEEAMRFLAEKGARNNEQIRVHDEQLREVNRRLDDIEEKAMRVPIIEDRQNTILQALNRARTAGWATAGSLLVLAATVVWQAGGG